MKRQSNQLTLIIFTALMAAIIYIGISLLRIPLPAVVGRPFIHFGNVLMVLAILFLGGKLGFIASGVGLGLFDILNGYAATSWLTVSAALVMAIVVASLVHLFKHKDTTKNIIIIGIIAGITKIITSYFVGVIEAMMVGTTFSVAIVSSFLSLLATVINSVALAIILPIAYFALKPFFKKFLN